MHTSFGMWPSRRSAGHELEYIDGCIESVRALDSSGVVTSWWRYIMNRLSLSCTTGGWNRRGEFSLCGIIGGYQNISPEPRGTGPLLYVDGLR